MRLSGFFFRPDPILLPYHRTESSTKAAAAAQLLLVEYCNTQVSHLCCCCSKLSRVSHRESSTLRPTLSSVDSRTSKETLSAILSLSRAITELNFKTRSSLLSSNSSKLFLCYRSLNLVKVSWPSSEEKNSWKAFRRDIKQLILNNR